MAMAWGKEKVQVNIPFILLKDTYLERFLDYGLNPEIGVDAEALDRCVPTEFEDIARRLHGGGLNITLHAPFVDLSPGSPDPEVRRVTRHRFEQVLPLLSVFKPKTVVCHAGYDAKRYWYMQERWVENSVGLWMWLGQRVRDEGAHLVLENVYEHGPGEIRVIFERLVNQKAGFCLDAGHHAVFSRVPL
jgi:sugar phosphate isomerase/epimerase